MQAAYELTKKDIVDGVVSNYKQHRTLWITAHAALIFGVAAFLLHLVMPAMYPRLTVNGLPIALFAVIYVWFFPRLAGFLLYSKAPWMNGAWKLIADNSGIHWEWNGGSADLEWKNFVSWFEGQNQFLLYSSRAAYHIVPKRAFSSEQIEELRALFARNIGGI
jgi:YcxB-like protein